MIVVSVGEGRERIEMEGESLRGSYGPTKRPEGR